MIKKETYRIIEDKLGSMNARLIKDCIMENPHGKGVPAMVTTPLILIQQPITNKCPRTQAFILVHEWLHIEFNHHRLLHVLMESDIVKWRLPAKHREIFLLFAIDLWTNRETKKRLGYAPRQAVFTQFNDDDGYTPVTWITQTAIVYWNCKAQRKKVLAMHKIVLKSIAALV